jgi:hypothetical protein
MMGHAHASSPVTETGKPLSMHGSNSPEVMRPSLSGIKSRTSQLQYQSPQEMNSNPYSPVTNPSSATYSGAGSSNGAESYAQSTAFKRSNSDSMSREHAPTNPMTGNRPQRHASFGVSDSKPADFSRPPLQTAVGPYGLLSSASGNQNYHSAVASPQGYVSQQNFTPFTLPPPGFATSATSTPTATRETDPTYPTSMPTEYPSDNLQHQQSGPDMMLLDQMTAPNTMPVFGGEGYNRSPFAIPEDFVAYLFSNQQLENSASPMGQMGQPGYAK